MIKPLPLISTFLNLYYRESVFKLDTKEKVVYLTFDDGPTPEVSYWVMDVLDKHDIKATFFCIGQQVEKYPDTFQEIIKRGHAIGNHTYQHLSGWKCTDEQYIADTEKAADLIQSKLFRPPYGRIKRSQYAALKSQYKIIMWDILSKDYDLDVQPEACIKNVVSNVKPGSIIVMHDSVKAQRNMKHSLPLIIHDLLKLGYRFGNLKEDLGLNASAQNISAQVD
jgi:peptidoglycan/xylan/chitin deacetylase (PgdA/CDA1 family)